MKAGWCTLLIGGLLCAGMSVQAGTLAWFQFDDRDPGTVVGGNGYGYVTNAVKPAMSVRACVIQGSSIQNPSGYPAFAPRYAAPHRGIQVYDPVTGTKRRNRASMFLTAGTVAGQGPSYYGSTLRVAGTDTSANPSDAFTIECFVCSTGTPVNVFAPIVAKRCSSMTAESWALYMTTNGKLECRLRTSGSTSARITGTSGQGVTLNDGGWHHVAYAYDKTDGIARVYVDYVEAFTFKTTAGQTGETVTYDTSADQEWAGALYVGAVPWGSGSETSGVYRKFHGGIDELRISDVALKPSQFLRLQPEDDDEIVRLRFDPQNLGTKQVSVYGNYNDRLDLPAKLTRGSGVNGSATVLDTTVKCAAGIRDGIYAPCEANGGAFNVATNGAGTGGYVKIAGFVDRMTGGVKTNKDFTVELFYRTRKNSKTIGKQSLFKIGGTPDAGLVLRNKSDGTALFTFNKSLTWAGVYSSETTACDGNWHHVATVCDSVRKEMRFYFDGKLSGSSTATTNILEAGCSLFVGAANDGTQWFDGYIDEVRVMNRALRPDEFLSTHTVDTVDADDATVAFMNFENDFATTPYPGLVGAGAGRAHGTTGAAPVFTSFSRTYLLDGSNGVDTVKSSTCALCNDSVITWPSSPLFEQPAFTVEFFANLEKVEGTGNLLRYVGSKDVSGGAPVWALFKARNTTRTLQTRFQLVKNGVTDVSYNGSWPCPVLHDGRWHHYALTVAPSATDSAKTEVELFQDYVSLGKKTLDGILDYSPALDGRLVWGASAAENKVFGKVDAIRFSRGVLAPAQFICARSTGALIIVR